MIVMALQYYKQVWKPKTVQSYSQGITFNTHNILREMKDLAHSSVELYFKYNLNDTFILISTPLCCLLPI